MDTEFRFRLRDAMQKAGINATELSRLSGVGKADISHYLKGSYVPKQDKCYYLAKALNVDPGWLMIGVAQGEEKQNTEDLLNFFKELEETGAYEVIDLYLSLSDEGKKKAMSYLEFLKSQEEIK